MSSSYFRSLVTDLNGNIFENIRFPRGCRKYDPKARECNFEGIAEKRPFFAFAACRLPQRWKYHYTAEAYIQAANKASKQQASTMMWWKGKDENGSSKSSPSKGSTLRGSRNATKNKNNDSGGSSGTNNNFRRRPRRGGNRGGAKDAPTSPSVMNEQEMQIGETVLGIEVSLSQESALEEQRKKKMSPKALLLVSFTEQLVKRRLKVYRTQYSNAYWPALDKKKAQDPTSPTVGDSDSVVLTSRPHRVPLTAKPFSTATMLYEDVLFLLQNHQVVDEITSVREELSRMNSEIEALEEDRVLLDKKRLQLPGKPNHEDVASHGAANAWEVHRLLLHKSKQQHHQRLSAADRDQLQDKRGLSLTFCLHNEKAKESFLVKCGAIASIFRAAGSKRYQDTSTTTTAAATTADVVTLDPENCRDGGAAATIQHVQLLKGSGYFLSRDNGKAYHWGHLPEKLHRRMKSAGMDSNDLIYLSTGPLSCYYAEFRSGESWWGTPPEDADFHAVCSEWNVYRVAFGSTKILDAKQRTVTSWIILGRDGRVAWKNLPVRLHHKLESRMANQAAPAEISLGSGDSFFIRFLDGSIDFSLPANVAGVCRKMVQQGISITSVSLHPEVSHDFVIRHCDVTNGQVFL